MKNTTRPEYETIAVNLTAEQVEQLRALKRLTRLSISDMAREAFSAYLAKRLATPSIHSDTMQTAKVG